MKNCDNCDIGVSDITINGCIAYGESQEQGKTFCTSDKCIK